ncbi:hypothetical protein EV426DRAFT_608180 [Tirmania nivea]|nr:hypothetical protein EV426DRAFT_608180 [Tirmania nivea]
MWLVFLRDILCAFFFLSGGTGMRITTGVWIIIALTTFRAKSSCTTRVDGIEPKTSERSPVRGEGRCEGLYPAGRGVSYYY